MIPRQHITHWAVSHPWPASEQVEQDLLLAQGMCEIAADPLLGEDLVVRGGGAFHKLFLPRPYRYSEDLDYVRTTAGGIGPITKRLTEMGARSGTTCAPRWGGTRRSSGATSANRGPGPRLRSR